MPKGLAPEPEHEALKQLAAYWARKKGNRLAPARADIDPAEMRRFLRHVFLLDVTGPPLRFKFRLVGTEIVVQYGAEVTGKFLDEVDLDDAGTEIAAEYERAVREFRPIYGRWDYIKKSGRYLSYERLILPLSSDGKTVDMLLCAAHARVRAANAARLGTGVKV